MRLQDLEDVLAVGAVGLVAGRAQGRGGRVGHHLQVVAGLAGEVDQVLVDDAAHAVAGAVDPLDVLELARLEDDADQRLVDHHRRPAALGHQHLVAHFSALPDVGQGAVNGGPSRGLSGSSRWPRGSVTAAGPLSSVSGPGRVGGRRSSLSPAPGRCRNAGREDCRTRCRSEPCGPAGPGRCARAVACRAP